MVTDIIVFDIETQKGFNDIPIRNNVWDLLMSTCVTYSYNKDEYKFWTYLKKDDLLSYMHGNILVGYNSINFDLKVLLGESTKVSHDFSVTNGENFSCSNIDIYLEMWKSISGSHTYEDTIDFMRKNPIKSKGVYSLDGVSKATLGGTLSKNGSGSFAPELYKTKRLIELFEYNLQDVRVTKKLYEFVKKYRYIVNGDYDIISMN